MTAHQYAQVFIELRAHDPEAVSAEQVARRQTPAGALARVRRFRLLEVRGAALPERAVLEDLLHRSTRFYNPAKERCRVRIAEADPAPCSDAERMLLVSDRGDERRPAAERWWRHETGQRVQVREGTAWVLEFAPGADAGAGAAALAQVRARREGLFANPHAQDCREAVGAPPLAWFAQRPRVARRRRGHA
jgi:hypothetical protein